MLRFSANLGFLWPDRPVLARIAAAGRAGFKAVELHSPYDLQPEQIAEACHAAGVKLLGINTPLGPAPAERGLAAVPGHEAQAREMIRTAFDFAQRAGGTGVHVMAGNVPELQRTAGRKTFVENLKFAADVAAKADLTVLLEPLNPRDMAGYFYTRVEDAISIMDEVGSDRVKLMFDCYHVGCVEGDVIMRMRKHFDRIGHIQVAAVPSRAEPDEGELAYGAIFVEIERLGWPGWVGAEYKPRGDTDAGLAWMQKLGVSFGS